MASLLKPDSEASLAETVREHFARRKPVRIVGGGTRPVGNPVDVTETLSTGRLSGITLYEPGALTLVAEAGTTLETITDALAEEGQHLPFEPADYCALLGTKGKSTIGGVVAAGVSGPRRVQAGAARDSLIGVRFVSGEGEIIKNGGRVMKNVTGYDLVKLMCGSYGTLGVLTEVSFKLLPRPQATGTVLITGLDDHAAVTVLSRALGSPFDVTGAAHLQKDADGNPVTMIRCEGLPESVKYRTGRLKDLLAPLLPSAAGLSVENVAESNAAIWKQVRDVETFAGRDGAVWRLSVKPSDGPDVVSDISGKLDCEALYDWGGGLVWLLVDAADDEAATVIRAAVDARGGHATLFRCNANGESGTDAFHPEHPRIAAISQNLRRQFDPAGILNPGLMGQSAVQA
ncbi:MAG: glycolate oxidase subunit GlcE [Nitratireductor sp.]|nr:glycolate oxidase subunit GlcE [Nitratireductor sp.]